MPLGLNFIMYVSLGFTLTIIISVYIFIFAINILFIIVLNFLFDNYLHYCMHAPFDYNCKNVLSSALYRIDFYVLHVLLYSMVQVSLTCTKWKSLGGGRGSRLFHHIIPPPQSMIKTTTTTIKDIFSLNQGDIIVNRNIHCISVFPFEQVTDDELASDLHNENINTNNNVQDQIDEVENMIMIEDRNYGTILSYIDPDLNILYNMNDAINTSSRYYDSYLFRSTFHLCKTQFSILNVNIRGMVTNLDNFKLFLEDLNNNFSNYRSNRKLVEATQCILLFCRRLYT